MYDSSNKICSHCQSEIIKGSDVKTCSICNEIYHQECWNSNKGCLTNGCLNQHKEIIANQNDNSQVSPIPKYDFTKSNSSNNLEMRKKYICIGAVLIIIFLFFLSSNSKINFAKKFDDISSESYCEIAEDGSYMKIDTGYSSSYEIMNLIEEVNNTLGFTNALFMKMEETRALDGVQTESNNRITVSWTYHPDDGLEIIYENK